LSAYYNEIEPYAAQWLRNLIKKGLIADGTVDERSIVDVDPLELARENFTQAHFFAGIGGWSHALRLAGWPDDRPVWTGSCPCQPFSSAGKGAGQADERHLWPIFFNLIRACRPPVVMGEQVAAAVGKSWLDGVSSDLEGIGYATGAAVVPACAVNAPHRRDRLWFVADASCKRRQQIAGSTHGDESPNERRSTKYNHISSSYGEISLANAGSGRRSEPSQGQDQLARGAEALGSGDEPLAHPDMPHGEGGRLSGGVHEEHAHHDGGSLHGAWSDSLWLAGADGKARRVKSGVCLLANGVPNRVGRLRAYGNAIVPQVAAEVIKAFMETES
jgi:DNA (cytosine-5)-methyltransferase 1